jgi:hypothetical protein
MLCVGEVRQNWGKKSKDNFMRPKPEKELAGYWFRLPKIAQFPFLITNIYLQKL